MEGILKAGEICKALGFQEEQVAKIEALPKAKHIFSHVEWHMIGYRVALGAEEDLSGKLKSQACFMVEKELLKSSYALPNAFRAYRVG